MAAIGPRAGAPVEQAEHVPGIGMKPQAPLQPVGDDRLQRRDRREGVGHGRRLAEQLGIDVEQQRRLGIGGPTDHDAVDLGEPGLGVGDAGDAAVDRDRQVRMRLLQPADAAVIEGRHVPVLPRRQALQPSLAGMHDEPVGARRDHGAGHRVEGLLDVLVIDAQAALHGDGHRHRRLHRRHTGTDEVRFAHQAGAEAPLLHPVGRAADIEVDLGIAEIGGDPRRRREVAGIGAAELHGDRMLAGIEAEQPLPVPVQHGAGRHHLGVEPGAARERPVERAALPVGPVHHRRDAEAPPAESVQFVSRRRHLRPVLSRVRPAPDHPRGPLREAA
ncbi:hypothetical protein CHKEEEPN_4110 [Methylorubrum podarium]|nr:hypothetical protein CHKEEEPN_4110 [Methylorubrum podarium]